MTSGAIPAGEVARKRVRPLDRGSSSAEPPGLGLDCRESLMRYLAINKVFALSAERSPNISGHSCGVPEVGLPHAGRLVLQG